MLVIVAGLLLRTVYNLTQVDAGFDRSRLVTFSMTLPRATKYEGGRAQVYQRLLAKLRAVPGVQAATAMSDLPLDPSRHGCPHGAHRSWIRTSCSDPSKPRARPELSCLIDDPGRNAAALRRRECDA